MTVFERENLNFIPAYATREFRNYGLHKKNSYYRFLGSSKDLILLDTGAVKLFPYEMCKFIANKDLQGYKSGEQINPNKFDFNSLRILVKTGIVKANLSDEFKALSEEDVISLVSLIGKSFKELSEEKEIEISQLKEIFGFKNETKKITEKDLVKLIELF